MHYRIKPAKKTVAVVCVKCFINTLSRNILAPFLCAREIKRYYRRHPEIRPDLAQLPPRRHWSRARGGDLITMIAFVSSSPDYPNPNHTPYIPSESCPFNRHTVWHGAPHTQPPPSPIRVFLAVEFSIKTNMDGWIRTDIARYGRKHPGCLVLMKRFFSSSDRP